MSLDKIKSLQEIVQIRDGLKSDGKKVVTTNGTFDIFHAGHVRGLEEARAQGEVLFVGVNSDESVKKYKSADRPVIPQELRAEVVAALACVDYVFIFDEVNPIAFLEKLKPDIHANSVEYGENCVEKETVVKNGGQLYLLRKDAPISTSQIIDKILRLRFKATL